MWKRKIKILSTLGPATINKRFLKFSEGKIDLLRLNMSHIEINKLNKIIKFIKKTTRTSICIDTEGAQIRTKVKKTFFFKKNKILKINSNGKGNFNLYPSYVFRKIKKGDVFLIGFGNLKTRVLKINKSFILLKTITPGLLENNKGVHIENRKIILNYITDKDLKAIKIGKKLGIKNYALSFTNNVHDMEKFGKILKKENKIFKIETHEAIKNIKKILNNGREFIIDRGDLSKEIKIENLPFIQRKIFKIAKKYNNKEIYIATNLLESMLINQYPTRGEANDIYNSLEMGAKGLVLAAETATGKYPELTVVFIQKMIKSYIRNNGI